MIRKRVVASVFALGIGLPLTVGAASAQAATYDNVDPSSTSCANSASTVSSASIKTSSGQTLGQVELRYSSTCRTVWARVSGGGYKAAEAAGPTGKIVRNSDGKVLYLTHCNSDHSSCYSNMLNDAGVTSYAVGYNDSSAYGTVGPVRTANY